MSLSPVSSSVFSVEMLPAGHGDCVLLRYGRGSEPYFVLIDGGPYDCYSALRSRLVALGRRIELLVVTHVDADHVEGIVKLLQDSRLALQIKDIWFNGWRHLEAKSHTLGPVAGEYLSTLISRHSLPWNEAFDGGPVVADPPVFPTVDLEGGLTITVLSPSKLGLHRLRSRWARSVAEEGLVPGSTRGVLAHMSSSRRFGGHKVLAGINLDRLSREAERSDESIVNGSSIALLAEFEGRRLLLGGDAQPTVLERAIRAWLKTHNQVKLHLDAFKIAHHGSKGSITNSLLKLLDCQNYLFSTNGKYFQHPDDEAVARVIRHGGPNPALHFNYQRPESRF
jgi:beta-lactamase superfamily II metal-dependent hydrolase